MTTVHILGQGLQRATQYSTHPYILVIVARAETM
jgi:hypothetical protein